MFSSIINLKFPSTAEAKIAASHFSEILGSKISHYDYLGIQITIGKSGELSVCVRFDDATRLKKFENDVSGLLSDIKKSFIYKEEKYSVAYGNMVGLLIEAIKEQQKQIEELKSNIEESK